jgi:hypothetical protein
LVATVNAKAFLEFVEVRILETHYALGSIRRPQAERAPAVPVAENDYEPVSKM